MELWCCYSSHKELKKRKEKNQSNQLSKKELHYHHHNHHGDNNNKNITQNDYHHHHLQQPMPVFRNSLALSTNDNTSEHTAIDIDYSHLHHNHHHGQEVIEEEDDGFITQLSAPPIRFFLQKQRWKQSNSPLNINKNEVELSEKDDTLYDPSTIDRNLSLSPFLGTQAPSPSKSIVTAYTRSPSPNPIVKSSWNWKRY
ncbi:hypothetical protein BJ944DRAFT_241194 [Cunninghamella echinulata]|nr:hypothetical protein BJ944DRAFT_241194 [Cunninghamella echinulata]